MNIEDSIELLKGFNAGDERAEQFKEAIETLLTAYEKGKEKNKELQNRVDYLSRISGLLSTDTIIEEE